MEPNKPPAIMPCTCPCCRHAATGPIPIPTPPAPLPPYTPGPFVFAMAMVAVVAIVWFMQYFDAHFRVTPFGIPYWR